MTDLVEFIEARLTEDETLANDATQLGPWYLDGDDEVMERGSGLIATGRWGGVGVEGPHIARHDPARVLREVEAKRKAIESHRWHGPDGCEEDRFCPLLTAMAAVWSDHPDYCSEWAPS